LTVPVSASPQRARATPPEWLSVAALLVVLAGAAALRWTSPADVADLRPRPDALEYEEAARSLAEGRGYRLWLAGDAYPPRYPPGMSLLIAASLPLLGDKPGAGIHVVLASALAAIAGTFVLARRAGGPAAALVAATLVATARLHVLWSQAVMSDVPATAAVAWLGAWTVSLLQRRARWCEHFALGAACGLAVWIRQPLVIVAAAVCLATLLLAPDDFAVRLRRAFVTGLGVIAGIAPFLWLNARLFGSPLRSGYGFWTPLSSFALGRAAASAGRPSTLGMYVRQLAGDASLYPWPAAVLLLAGTAVALRLGGRARTLCAFTWLLTTLFVGMLASYSLATNRLLLPVLPLLAATMSLTVADAAPRIVRALGAALFAGALWLNLTIPSALLGQPTAPMFDTATLEKIAAVAEPNAAVLAYSSPFLFERVLRRNGADRVWIPLRVDEHMLSIAALRLQPLERDPQRAGWIEQPIVLGFRPDRVIARIEALCRDGRPVYLSTQRAVHVVFMPELERTLRERFGLTQVVPPDPWAVYRVGCDAPAVVTAPTGRGERRS
jgi:4-amino-4-deoxy-L-arabinose transferase-like glycosyltransferase